MSELSLAEGTLIAGRYRLEHHLGEGGMGTVWAALHTVTQRAVAMKFLKESVRHRKDLRERFLREAATASSLEHPNVVEIIDVFDFEEASPVMVMELLEGETLGNKLLRDERLGLEETAALLVPVVSAVGTAHARGIVHRDLKPENLFLIPAQGGASSPLVKVLDFGIAKLTAERYFEGGPSALLTESGSLLGTPCYMAPEQASGEQPLDHRADIWSLGVILYECLSGGRPIEGDSTPQVVARLMSAGIMPLERIAPQLPADVTGLVKQMLTREVSRRTPSLLDVQQALSRYTNVTAPEFGPPILRGASMPPTKPRTTEVAPVRAQLVAGRDVDPQGPTMISSPPVNNSLHLSATPPRRNAAAYVGAAVALLLGLGGWVWGATRQAGGVAAAVVELPTLATAPVNALVLPDPSTVASGLASTAPAPSTNDLVGGALASDTAAPTGVKQPKPKSKSGNTPIGSKPNSQPKTQPSVSDDWTKFGGRK